MIDAEFNHCCTFYSTMPVELIPSLTHRIVVRSVDVQLDDETDASLHSVLLCITMHRRERQSRHLSDDRLHTRCQFAPCHPSTMGWEGFPFILAQNNFDRVSPWAWQSRSSPWSFSPNHEAYIILYCMNLCRMDMTISTDSTILFEPIISERVNVLLLSSSTCPLLEIKGSSSSIHSWIQSISS
jgi:hypothetical protein